MRSGLDHVTLTASDFAASLAFYDATLGALGLVRFVEFGDEEEDDAEIEAAAWGVEGGAPVLWLVAGERATSAVHLCLAATSPTEVRDFHAAALARGGRSHDAPRRWAIFRRGQFNAIVLDPDGNLIEAVAAE